MSEIKKGDRVKVVGACGFYQAHIGKTGRVTREKAGEWCVLFDDGHADYTNEQSDLERLDAAVEVKPTGLSIPDFTLSAPREGRMEIVGVGGEYFPIPHAALEALHALLGEALTVWPVEVSE